MNKGGKGMSINFYRQKQIYDDGVLLHIVNTKSKTYLSSSNEHRETGLHILDAIGGRFYYNDCGDDIVSIEIPLYDILDSIRAIDDGDFDNKFSKESIDRVRDDLMSMKIKLEQDKDDLFILYAL